MTFALRWYALAYIVGIVAGWRLVVRAVRTPRLWPDGQPVMTPTQIEDLLIWVILGVILGGRLGYVLFYQPAYYLANPAEILQVWQGGMSFHGGALGVIVAAWIYTGRHGIARISRGRPRRPRHLSRAPAGSHRQFHQRRALGPAHGSALGRRLSDGGRAVLPRCRRHLRAPPLAAL